MVCFVLKESKLFSIQFSTFQFYRIISKKTQKHIFSILVFMKLYIIVVLKQTLLPLPSYTFKIPSTQENFPKLKSYFTLNLLIKETRFRDGAEVGYISDIAHNMVDRQLADSGVRTDSRHVIGLARLKN